MERRNFLKIAGAATVATALPGCTSKEPKSLLPYIIPDEEIIPGRSVMYATVCRECPAGCGMRVRVREGRATKAEGNPLHPVNKGALCARGQASLQGLYNPDRIQTPLRKTETGKWERIGWEEAETFLVEKLQQAIRDGKGKNVAWVSPLVSGTLDGLINDWLRLSGSVGQRYQYEPFHSESSRLANAAVFGVPWMARYDLSRADTIISFGADFLETWLSPVEFAQQLAQSRGSSGEHRNRFVYIGPRLSMTASNADVWFNVAPEAMGRLALSLVHVALEQGETTIGADEAGRIKKMVDRFSPEVVAGDVGMDAERIIELGKSLVRPHATVALAAGPLLENEQGVATAAAVNLLNYVCGAVGRSVNVVAPVNSADTSSSGEMLSLAESMERGDIPLIFLHEVNPVFTLPAGDRFAAALGHVPFVVSFTTFMDETAALASLILPLHSPLESWGDFEPYHGIHGLMQPVMEPVFGTKMLGDILLETGTQLSSEWKKYPSSFQAHVKETWRSVHKRIGETTPFETFWTESLARGGAWEDAEPAKVRLSPTFDGKLFDPAAKQEEKPAGGYSLLVYPSIAHYDGRGANKPWLQELPDPMTRLVWGTWAEIHPDDAAKIGVRDGDPVILAAPRGEIEVRAFLTSGIRKGSVAVPIGQGHTEYGRFADGVGANPIKLLTAQSDSGSGRHWYMTTVEIRKGQRKKLSASVQEVGSEHHREIVQVVSMEVMSTTAASEGLEAPTIYPREPYAKHHWGMTVDLDRCTGCAACVTACYAENNVPVVGKDEVINGREMAWIRVDRYYDEEAAAEGTTRARFIPMFCQQCGAAPCETVCPVYAAYHTEEGLNGQVYNRCIGTRYCANNCPYKVRRFNWFGHDVPSPLNWQLNPDVTVRTKGVMEKCTFCIQRIVEGKNNARMEQRPVREGEIRTACQQTCPAQAITFGDLKEEQSMVSVQRRDGLRAYHVLEELNTTPAVTYMKKISEMKDS